MIIITIGVNFSFAKKEHGTNSSWKRRVTYFVLTLYLCLPAMTMSASSATVRRTVDVDLVVARNAPVPLKFGVQQLVDTLRKTGRQVSVTSHPSAAEIQFVVRVKNDPYLVEGKTKRPKALESPESYNVWIASNRSVFIEGSDATGAMYGALDVAEQIRWANASNLVGQIRPSTESPYLQVRGINIFLTTQDIDNPEGSFWSDEYWEDFLNMMARDRYNFLDIHGPCDAVTLRFPNAYSYFVSLPDFPNVGVDPHRAARNMARLRKIVHMAADRGIKVGYMNYEASPPIGPWKTRRFGVDERWTPITQKFLTGPAVIKYTREAVASFLKQLPDLWMLGFRIGESGQPAGFYKETYLEALKNAAPNLKVYLRTWVADPQKVRELGRLTIHPLYIEIKYNGEQLGLPYQAALGGRDYPPSGSYENYTDYPRGYSIIWQIRAHGTHRVFCWMWPAFARRTVRSCKFGGGVGFSMEQMNAYCPEEDYLHHNPKIDHHFYKWMFQRYWMWNLVWGRTAYDPNTPDQVFINHFIERFGVQAGPVLFKALTNSSKIVPFIYAYHNVGLDHQDFAPEFETGDHALSVPSRIWTGTRLIPYGGNNFDFLRVNTLDRTAMADPVVYVNARLRGVASGKMGPFEAADYLDRAATTSETEIAKAARLNLGSPKNFDCIRMDIEAVAWLGRYYANRIRSATHLEFYRQTHSHPDLDQAYDDLAQAVSDWDHLSEIADWHFGYVPEYIRMGVKAFRWSDERRSLGMDLEQINNLERQFRKLRGERFQVLTGYVPPFRVRPGQPLNITVTAATASKESDVYLFYRNAEEKGYTQIALMPNNRFERTWAGQIPGNQVVLGFLDYYFEVSGRKDGPYGGTLEMRPPYHVLVNDDESKPVISHTSPPGPMYGNSLILTAAVKDRAGISAVYVYYKRTPAYYDWVRIEMHAAGNSHYTATVPLTPEGILYYFEAIDRDGNAVNCPQFLKRTPYFVIDAWNPERVTADAAR